MAYIITTFHSSNFSDSLVDITEQADRERCTHVRIVRFCKANQWKRIKGSEGAYENGSPMVSNLTLFPITDFSYLIENFAIFQPIMK